MDQPLDIRDVARRTGLTSRALRFYEARGLLKPLRTYSGRRLYGGGELERIQQILALKRAGLSLAQIGRLTERGAMELRSLVDAQLKTIEERKAELDEAPGAAPFDQVTHRPRRARRCRDLLLADP